jgi:hypothetical protein
LLVFLTPHVIRNRSQLRGLALDERQKFMNSLGRKEIHDMPASQIQQLYKPSFSIAVPPEADLGASYGGAAAVAPAAPEGSMAAPAEAPPPASGGSGATGETPFNTEEIGPSSMKHKSAPAPGVASAAGAPAPAAGASSASAAPSGARALDAPRFSALPRP